jgi:HK97 family phage prohead protease
LPDGQVEVIVSNSGTDRHGEKILVEGIDTKQVMRNPVVLWGHDYGSLPIGKILKIWKSGGNLKAKIEFAVDLYDFAKTAYEMVKAGFVNAVSIGGIVKQWNQDYTVIEKLEMVELSVVPVGAHPDALVTAKGLKIDKDTIQKQYLDFMRKSLIEKIQVMPEDEVQNSIKALKNLVSALESTYKADSVETESSTKRVKRLVLARNTARKCDSVAELIINAITSKI